ncbi:Restriction endonuclease [Mycolicibacterium obuense]|uniref:Restriction endonuclease n=2 Tax=Mycolicibacterium obuense TaxID=1807 RepID=A0A0J6ZBH9_9MYCO|nr:Restriction endonuclease [Mycolicibacterium obuense]
MRFTFRDGLIYFGPFFAILAITRDPDRAVPIYLGYVALILLGRWALQGVRQVRAIRAERRFERSMAEFEQYLDEEEAVLNEAIKRHRQANLKAERSRVESAAQRAELTRLEREAEYRAAGWSDIDVMSGIQFEHYVAALIRSAGWSVSTTPATGDYGVDLIAAKNSHKVAIQCKRLATPVGVSAVQQAAPGAVRYRCATSMVVTNAEFTKAAKLLAADHDCRLVGRSCLLEVESWMPQTI